MIQSHLNAPILFPFRFQECLRKLVGNLCCNSWNFVMKNIWQVNCKPYLYTVQQNCNNHCAITKSICRKLSIGSNAFSGSFVWMNFFFRIFRLELVLFRLRCTKLRIRFCFLIWMQMFQLSHVSVCSFAFNCIVLFLIKFSFTNHSWH